MSIAERRNLSRFDPPQPERTTALAAERPQLSTRLASLDAFRGFVVFLMVAEICLQLHRVAVAVPQSRLLQFLGHHQTHVAWSGASLHDLIHPCFTFLVGVALPYSLMKRLSQGQSMRAAIGHAAWRSLVLICLGIFLRSAGHEHTVFIFMAGLAVVTVFWLIHYWMYRRRIFLKI